MDVVMFVLLLFVSFYVPLHFFFNKIPIRDATLFIIIVSVEKYIRPVDVWY